MLYWELNSKTPLLLYVKRDPNKRIENKKQYCRFDIYFLSRFNWHFPYRKAIMNSDFYILLFVALLKWKEKPLQLRLILFWSHLELLTLKRDAICAEYKTGHRTLGMSFINKTQWGGNIRRLSRLKSSFWRQNIRHKW